MPRSAAVLRRPPSLPRRPLCFTDREYTAWVVADYELRWSGKWEADPCCDCTRAFAREMRFEHRCDGEPGGR